VNYNRKLYCGIKLVEPLLELPEHYEEVDMPEGFSEEMPPE
jgi:hypothetical protein